MKHKLKKPHIIIATLLFILLLSSYIFILNEKSVTFIYFGDSQSNESGSDSYAGFGNLVKKSFSDAPNAKFFVIGGDLINDESDMSEWHSFLQSISDITQSIPCMPIVGNHTPGEVNYKDLFHVPQNGPNGLKSNFYSFEEGNAHFTMVDSNLMGTLDQNTVKVIHDWLSKDLKGTKKHWKVVVMHHPMYPVLSNYKDEIRAETMRANYLKLFEQQGVDLILCGHQHVYARTYPLKEGNIANNTDGIVQIMGISSDKYYGGQYKNYVEFAKDNQSVYTVITTKNKRITIQTKDENFKIIDECTWLDHDQ